MAWLIVEQEGKRQAGAISGRVLIGRRPESQIRSQHKTVSRIHAWIAAGAEGEYFIADAGSRTGTFVNDERVTGRRALASGDRILIGPMVLRLADQDAQADGVETLDLSQRAACIPSPKDGIWLDCMCGAPLWAPWDFAGKSAQCRQCGSLICVPSPSPASSPSRDPDESEAAADPIDAIRFCGVCHGEISVFEEADRCRDCGTVFHVECWQENMGCSVYGCSQVNALASGQPSTAVPENFGGDGAEEDLFEEKETADNASADPSAAPEPVPWPYALLAAGVLGAVLGTLTFGATALAAAIAGFIYLSRAERRQQRQVVVLSIVVSLTGLVAGVALSYYWWFGGKPWVAMR